MLLSSFSCHRAPRQDVPGLARRVRIRLRTDPGRCAFAARRDVAKQVSSAPKLFTTALGVLP
jgi:hypothetical protein